MGKKRYTEYFFRTHTVELLRPEFRKLSTFGKTAQDAARRPNFASSDIASPPP